jgi:hypothetical protein
LDHGSVFHVVPRNTQDFQRYRSEQGRTAQLAVLDIVVNLSQKSTSPSFDRIIVGFDSVWAELFLQYDYDLLQEHLTAPEWLASFKLVFYGDLLNGPLV